MNKPKEFWDFIGSKLKSNQRAVYVFDNKPDEEPNYAILIFERDEHGLWHIDPEAVNDYFMESLERINVVQKPAQARFKVHTLGKQL